jgi:hypothetical protein
MRSSAPRRDKEGQGEKRGRGSVVVKGSAPIREYSKPYSSNFGRGEFSEVAPASRLCYLVCKRSVGERAPEGGQRSAEQRYAATSPRYTR